MGATVNTPPFIIALLFIVPIRSKGSLHPSSYSAYTKFRGYKSGSRMQKGCEWLSYSPVPDIVTKHSFPRNLWAEKMSYNSVELRRKHIKTRHSCVRYHRSMRVDGAAHFLYGKQYIEYVLSLKRVKVTS
jgi:hypothetical protein